MKNIVFSLVQILLSVPVSAVSVDGICCADWALASSVLPLIMDALWSPQGR